MTSSYHARVEKSYKLCGKRVQKQARVCQSLHTRALFVDEREEKLFKMDGLLCFWVCTKFRWCAPICFLFHNKLTDLTPKSRRDRDRRLLIFLPRCPFWSEKKQIIVIRRNDTQTNARPCHPCAIVRVRNPIEFHLGIGGWHQDRAASVPCRAASDDCMVRHAFHVTIPPTC